jgi:hypothetical protein
MERARTRLWLRRFGWLIAIWAGGVLALGAVATLIRWFMEAAGLRG